jgi:hypothetical protein
MTCLLRSRCCCWLSMPGYCRTTRRRLTRTVDHLFPLLTPYENYRLSASSGLSVWPHPIPDDPIPTFLVPLWAISRISRPSLGHLRTNTVHKVCICPILYISLFTWDVVDIWSQSIIVRRTTMHGTALHLQYTHTKPIFFSYCPYIYPYDPYNPYNPYYFHTISILSHNYPAYYILHSLCISWYETIKTEPALLPISSLSRSTPLLPPVLPLPPHCRCHPQSQTSASPSL